MTISLRARVLIKHACAYYGVGVSVFWGPSRITEVVRAREAVCHIMRHQFEWSYPRIGRCLKKHHTTVISAVRRAEQHYESDIEFQQLVNFLRAESEGRVTLEQSELRH